LIPYQHPDISPFERPLRLDEIERFASRFRSWTHREFELPPLRLAEIVKVPERVIVHLRRWERGMLDHSSMLARLATAMVFEVRK
jgi:hypothetical protein